ncbi:MULTISPECIES: hypothetical protein [Spiroplasma]|nr:MULTISPECIES: hypothetical protein [Spiroplasma]MBH8623475.1 hypothetical protein [Spiroplasma sp. hyd1]UNF62020.1 hypothetical protein MNU24_00715 [Spiroplasma poulsonii]
MGIIGRIIGIGEDSKQKAAEKNYQKDLKWQREQQEIKKERLEKVKQRILEGKEQHVVAVLMEGKYGMERLTNFVNENPGVIPSYVLPTEELKKLNGDNII